MLPEPKSAKESRLLLPFLDADGRLTALPAKRRKKLLALWMLAERFDSEKRYTEPEINELLDAWTTFHDPATLRRELYHHRLLNRTPNGTEYWKENVFPTPEVFLSQSF